MTLTNWANHSNQDSHYNFDDWNYSSVNLGKGEVAWSFKNFLLEELINKPSNVWPTPSAIYLTTQSWNIYSIYETGVFVDKNPWVHNLSDSQQNDIVNADLIVLNSKNKKIHLIDLSISDNVLQLGSPFRFSYEWVSSNTSNITEIIGDSWVFSWNTSGKVNDIKKRLVDNIGS